MDGTLINQWLTIKTHSQGGELTSLCGQDGTEYLWQGDPAFWGGQAPVLFPIVGCLKNGIATTKSGRVCQMPRHGFARKRRFSLVATTEESLVYQLSADQWTKAQYPFDFRLQIEYLLQGKSLTTTYTVTNLDSLPLPFQIGGHPGFHLPIQPGLSFSDYVVEFAHRETADCPGLDEAGLIDPLQRRRVLNDTNRLPLHPELFAQDALIFDDLRSRQVKLIHAKTGQGIQFDFSDFDYFLLWSSSPPAPFICLEPWTGLSGQVDDSPIFEERQGTVILPPGVSRQFSFTITI